MLHKKGGEQKSLNQLGLFNSLVLLSIFFSSLYSGSFSEFKRSQADMFVQYKNENDQAFNKYLKENWEGYDPNKLERLYATPKPSRVESARKIDFKKIGPTVQISLPTEISEDNRLKVEVMSSKKELEFAFFGTMVGFNYPVDIKNAKFYPQNKKGVSNFFDMVVSTEYESFIQEISETSKKLNLNDWGRYLLIQNIAKKIFSSQDDARLLSWFIFNKLGYIVKVAISNRHIVELFHSKKLIYSTPNYKIGDKNYYILSEYGTSKLSRIYTYTKCYPESKKGIDLNLESLPLFEKDIRTKTVNFSNNGKKYNFTYRYNQNLIDFMATYPQADYETFFHAPIDKITYDDLVLSLRKYINSTKTSEAINFILSFVQKSFKYKVDAEQFGREKVMFAQETLYYSASDCEDRAVLFAKIITKLFNISVVGVKYKDHMATALYAPIKGDALKVDGRRFIIADPSYQNGSVGQSMGKYKSKKPERFVYMNQKTE